MYTILRSTLIKWLLVPLTLCAAAYGVYYVGFDIYKKATAASFGDFKTCFATSTDPTFASTCLHETARSLLSSYSTKDIQAYTVASSSAAIIQKNCHAIGHIVGEETYKEIGGLERALSLCSSSCQYACIHGVLGAGVLSELGEEYQDDIAHADDAMIKRIGGVYCEQSVALCHGIGHIAYIVHGDNPQALEICSSITAGFAREACYQGVFMERAGEGESLNPFQATTTYTLTTNDYTAPCVSTAPQYRHACFQFLPKYQDVLFKKNGIADLQEKLEKAISVCSILTGRDRSYCFEGMGIQADTFAQDSLHLEEYHRLCNQMPKAEDKTSCTIGVIPRDFFLGGYGFNYCSGIQDVERQTVCFNAAFNWAEKMLGGVNKIQNTCRESGSLCAKYFEKYAGLRLTLPDYRFGLFGEI